ncbi:MAG: hypothetical protein COV44_02315 [Deltaproteobacteria bacterium CG11_big_fil_rev_8_21_14_0_20_45_16]|nr:MAG: hypothetical protein COV44_02315 [Deltaproteobacteria bacterium CG11_big_fil_rev_8_21_14_0_20_45_16]
MENEASVVARKLETYFRSQNDMIEETLPPANDEPGLIKNALIVFLMSFAIFFTKITLMITQWVRRLEGV